jgi:hypothetical protein
MKKKASKKKYQKPISLHPLTPDEALKAALQTPPPPKGFFFLSKKKERVDR